MKRRVLRSCFFASLVVVLELGCDAEGARPTGQRAGVVAEVEPQAGGAPPGQRWVLRDSEGAAVNAVVYPTCAGNGPNCVVNEIGAVGAVTPECARVVWLGDQYVDLKYDLTTGRAEDCSDSVPNIAYIGVYVEPACGGDIHSPPGEGTDSATKWTRRAKLVVDTGTLLFESSSVDPIHPDTVYPIELNCAPYAYDEDLVPWFAVPGWALDALPNPPYALTWE